MTCTYPQIQLLKKYIKFKTLEAAAAKAGMDIKTARKYLRSQKLPNELKKLRNYNTRPDPFAKHWDQIVDMLIKTPELQANQLLIYLMEQYPSCYKEKHLRSLQRRIQHWNAEHGKDRAVIFPQNILPGKQSQSDWTNMNKLKITINGSPFPHLLFHFVLPFSRWETIMICFSESFDSLTSGYEQAVWELGGTVPEHRTDNLSAATKKSGNKRAFTTNWTEFLTHYNVTPSRNNPGISHENGSIEKSHDILKNTVKQYLLIRGSRDFIHLNEYEAFINNIKNKRNATRKELLAIEIPLLQKLPEVKWEAATILNVRVTTASLVNILKIPYSVPSRLIGYNLRAYVYFNSIELYYGNKCLQIMPRVFSGESVDYRHIIDSLVRKPRAFLNYKYRQCLFPQAIFRKAYDKLTKKNPSTGYKTYLKILQLAKMYGEQQIVNAINIVIKEKKNISLELLKQIIEVPQVRPLVQVKQLILSEYDQLHNFRFKKENNL